MATRNRVESRKARNNRLNPWFWPTLKELHEATWPETRSTINQIIRGQGYSYGYECERHCDNDFLLYDNIGTYTTREEILETSRIRRAERKALMTEEQKFRSRYRKAIRIVSLARKIPFSDAEKIVRMVTRGKP